MVDSSAAKSSLSDLKGSSLAEDEVFLWHADVIVLPLGVAFRLPRIA